MIGFLKKILLSNLVAVDKFGNHYYQQRERRWVTYNGLSEPSKIPPQYYLWLHNSVDKIQEQQGYKWEKDRMPNLTGTSGLYLPDGHILKNPFKATRKDYLAWSPNYE